MKRLTLTILCLFFLLPGLSRAETFLRGRVIAIDRPKGEITITPLLCDGCLPGRPGATVVRPPEAGDERAAEPYIISTDFIPPCVAPEAIVHVWGEMVPDGGNRFQAKRITGPGWRHDEDATGVRSRIRKRCFMRQNHHPDGGAE